MSARIVLFAWRNVSSWPRNSARLVEYVSGICSRASWWSPAVAKALHVSVRDRRRKRERSPGTSGRVRLLSCRSELGGSRQASRDLLPTRDSGVIPTPISAFLAARGWFTVEAAAAAVPASALS